MKTFKIIIIFIFSYQFSAFSQFREGFDKQEVLDMIKICNSFTYIDLYQNDKSILPSNYEKVYSSGVFGMDNVFQIYEGPRKTAVINLRGSTEKKISWMENLYASMIPGQGVIEVEENVINYKFALDTSAHVHSGYALGIAYLKRDLIFHINNLNKQGIYHILITGHSQGGALSQMLMAYLNNLPKGEISSKCRFKIYAFAAPKVGNAAFVEEYDSRFTNKELSFLIINPVDPVPKMPLSYQEGKLINQEQIIKILSKEENFSLKDFALNGLANVFENKLGKTSNWFSKNVGKQISKDLGHYKIPPFTNDINYARIGNVIELQPVEYPIHLKDSSILQNDSLMNILPIDKDGLFEDKSYYETGSRFYQHKPHNYYMTLLRKYYPEEYKKTNPKFLKENL